MKHFTAALIYLMLLGFATTTSAQNANSNAIRNDASEGPVISVYVSSPAGDRLTKKANARFRSNSESSLPVIKIDE